MPEQAIVNEYMPGQGIGMHADAASFGPVIVSLSLAADQAMRFRRGTVRPYQRDGLDGDEIVTLPRRSALVLTGRARTNWMHGICRRQPRRVPAPLVGDVLEAEMTASRRPPSPVEDDVPDHPYRGTSVRARTERKLRTLRSSEHSERTAAAIVRRTDRILRGMRSTDQWAVSQQQSHRTAVAERSAYTAHRTEANDGARQRTAGTADAD